MMGSDEGQTRVRPGSDLSGSLGLLSSLRAFIWLRWRLLVNSIYGGQKRDRMEQISRAFALFVPIILATLSIGSVVAIAIAGFIAGRAVARGLLEPDIAVVILRFMLFGGLVLLTLVSVVSPHQTSIARYTRLVLLPIPRQTLHLVEVLAGMADPVVAFVVPGLLLFAFSLAVHGYLVAGAWTLAATIGLVMVFTALSAVLSFLVAWLLRSRRRGELFTLVFVLAISLVSFVPAFFGERFENEARGRAPGEPRRTFSVDAFDRRLPAWTRGLPSELYGRAIAGALAGHNTRAAVAVLLLFLEGAVLYAASSAIHRQLLTGLEGDRVRRRNTGGRSALGQLPLLSPEASAVAWAQARTGLRSVRGRLLVLLPGPMLAMMALLFKQMDKEERFVLTVVENGHLMLGMAGLFSLYAMQALTMNMFGSDRAGLTLQFLSPISDRELARGKVAGCALVFAVSMALALVSAILVADKSAPSLWIAVLLGVFAAYVLLSPAYVWLSALFPVASDLSKTGSGGNPHPLPMLAGLVLVLISVAPAGLIIVLTQTWLEQPALAPMLMIGWLLIALLIAVPLVSVASRTIGMRRENLALVAQGK